jgi:hypothetical protein
LYQDGQCIEYASPKSEKARRFDERLALPRAIRSFQIDGYNALWAGTVTDSIILKMARRYRGKRPGLPNAEGMQNIAVLRKVCLGLIDPLIDHVEKFFLLIECDLKRCAVGLCCNPIVDECSER